MDIRYQCNFADYKEAHDAQIRKPSATPVLLFGAMFFTFLAISNLMHGRPLQSFVYALVAAFSLLPPLLRAYQRFWIKHTFRESGFGEGARMAYNDQGVEIDGPAERQELKWAALTRFQETDNLFILHKVGGRVQVIPKRFFPENEIKEFRTLLARNIRAAG